LEQINHGKETRNVGIQKKVKSHDKGVQTVPVEVTALSSFGQNSEADNMTQEQTDNSTNLNYAPGFGRPRIQSANRSSMSHGVAFYKEGSHSGMTSQGPSQPHGLTLEEMRALQGIRPTISAANKYRPQLNDRNIIRQEDYNLSMLKGRVLPEG